MDRATDVSCGHLAAAGDVGWAEQHRADLLPQAQVSRQLSRAVPYRKLQKRSEQLSLSSSISFAQ